MRNSALSVLLSFGLVSPIFTNLALAKECCGAAKAKTKSIKRQAAKPSKSTAATGLAATVWNPSGAIGTAAASYAAAKTHPELMARLFCYCGCDVAENMPSLLTCFQSDHSLTCSVCQDEALLAAKAKRSGASIGQIQRQVDQRFAGEYPFSEPSKILLRYRSNREYTP